MNHTQNSPKRRQEKQLSARRKTLKSHAGDGPAAAGCPVSNPDNNCANGLFLRWPLKPVRLQFTFCSIDVSLVYTSLASPPATDKLMLQYIHITNCPNKSQVFTKVDIFQNDTSVLEQNLARWNKKGYLMKNRLVLCSRQRSEQNPPALDPRWIDCRTRCALDERLDNKQTNKHSENDTNTQHSDQAFLPLPSLPFSRSFWWGQNNLQENYYPARRSARLTPCTMKSNKKTTDYWQIIFKSHCRRPFKCCSAVLPSEASTKASISLDELIDLSEKKKPKGGGGGEMRRHPNRKKPMRPTTPATRDLKNWVLRIPKNSTLDWMVHISQTPNTSNPQTSQKSAGLPSWHQWCWKHEERNVSERFLACL